jgi:hypothetical protein
MIVIKSYSRNCFISRSHLVKLPLLREKNVGMALGQLAWLSSGLTHQLEGQRERIYRSHKDEIPAREYDQK